MGARGHSSHANTFVGAEESPGLTFLSDQKRQLVKLVAELKAENRRAAKAIGTQTGEERLMHLWLDEVLDRL